MDEAEIEAGLVEHIQKVLVELGTGFAFVARQYRVVVEGEEFAIEAELVKDQKSDLFIKAES